MKSYDIFLLQSPVEVESGSTLERVPSECVSCAIEKGLASEQSETSLSTDTRVSLHIHELHQE